MNESILNKYVKKCEMDFLSFTGIESMPHLQIEPKEVSLKLAEQQGVWSPAEALYDIPTGMHKLKLLSAIPHLRADYLVFHELSHILDAETYSKRDKFKHFSNRL